MILHQDVPLYDVYAWERWGNFINAEAGSKTEIPYDAAHLQVKVYTFPTGEIRGDFALHQKGVLHLGEEIRRNGGIDLEFAIAMPGRHNDPTAYWSLAREHPIQAAAAWRDKGRYVEAIGSAAASAPADAARYRVRLADLPGFPAREVYLTQGHDGRVTRDGARSADVRPVGQAARHGRRGGP